MIRKSLLLKPYDAAYMQRWNDKIRPVELRELDKQAHKMIIAFILAKYQEDKEKIDWIKLIEACLFEFLQRIVLTDLKPQLFHRIQEDSKGYAALNNWIYQQLEPMIIPLNEGKFAKRFLAYINTKTSKNSQITRKILNASHFYATRWEFGIIKQPNADIYEIKEIEDSLDKEMKRYSSIIGISKLETDVDIKKFCDLCGLLRFQLRWSQTERIPKTSVLGHMLIVAIYSYFISLELKLGETRLVNNFYNGLFHDFPEVLTRDVIAPVKTSIKGLDSIIKKYENEQMKKEVYNSLPSKWRKQMRKYTATEFKSEISGPYAKDGDLVEAADHLAAFIEAYLAIKNGSGDQTFYKAKEHFRKQYMEKDLKKNTDSRKIKGFDFSQIYADFN